MSQKERWYYGPYEGNPWFQFSSHLDRFDRNWRNDPFWRDLYPRWAEPIFKEGIDVKTDIINDRSRFAVGIDAYQFRPEELQVGTGEQKSLQFHTCLGENHGRHSADRGPSRGRARPG